MAVELVESRVDAPIGKIQVFRGGSGAPLVYLHSAGGESVIEALSDLAESYDVVVPVFPGFGESDGIDDVDGMDDAVFHLLDMWDLLGLDAPAVLGLSLGGWIAAELAMRYPEKVGRLVLVNPVGLYVEGAPIEEMFGRSPAELAEMLFVDQQHPMAQMMHAMSEWTGDVGQQVEIPLELVLPIWKAMAATSASRLGPVPARPEAAGPAAADHRADAGRRGRAGRPGPARARGGVRRGDTRRASRRRRRCRALAPVREARRARRAGPRLPRVGRADRGHRRFTSSRSTTSTTGRRSEHVRRPSARQATRVAGTCCTDSSERVSASAGSRIRYARSFTRSLKRNHTSA